MDKPVISSQGNVYKTKHMLILSGFSRAFIPMLFIEVIYGIGMVSYDACLRPATSRLLPGARGGGSPSEC